MTHPWRLDGGRPAISIVVPVYNAQKYLRRCIHSVLAQRFADFELILVNDGSTDASGAICDDLAQSDPRLRVYHQANGGPSAARNQGIALARGQYLGFVDADDSIDSMMYQRLYQLAEETGADVSVCNYISQVNGLSHVMLHGFGEGEQLKPPEIRTKLIHEFYSDGNRAGLLSLCNKLFSHAFILEHNIRCDPARIRAEDAFFCLEAYRQAQGIAFTSAALYTYHCNQGSIMQSVRSTQFEDWKRNINELYLLNERYFGFVIDKPSFLKGYLINIAQYLLDISESERDDKRTIIDSILLDPAYLDMLGNDQLCPSHYRLLHKQLRSACPWRRLAAIRLMALLRRLSRGRVTRKHSRQQQTNANRQTEETVS